MPGYGIAEGLEDPARTGAFPDFSRATRAQFRACAAPAPRRLVGCARRPVSERGVTGRVQREREIERVRE